jgi:hypothetical protein
LHATLVPNKSNEYLRKRLIPYLPNFIAVMCPWKQSKAAKHVAPRVSIHWVKALSCISVTG